MIYFYFNKIKKYLSLKLKIMKKLILLLVLVFVSSVSFAQNSNSLKFTPQEIENIASHYEKYFSSKEQANKFVSANLGGKVDVFVILSSNGKIHNPTPEQVEGLVSHFERYYPSKDEARKYVNSIFDQEKEAYKQKKADKKFSSQEVESFISQYEKYFSSREQARNFLVSNLGQKFMKNPVITTLVNTGLHKATPKDVECLISRFERFEPSRDEAEKLVLNGMLI